jgi:hypothetical protein
MARMKEFCNELFTACMEEELNQLLNGESRRETLEGDARAYGQQRVILEKAAEENPKYAATLAAKVPTVEQRREMARAFVIMNGPGLPAGVPREEWLKYASRTSVTPDFHFLRDPLWDHDDCAEYCLAPEGLVSHKALFIRWLSHQWSIREVSEAKSALLKAFQPLLRKLTRKYRDKGYQEFGNKYGPYAYQHLSAALDRHIDEFDFFHRRYAKVSDKRFSADQLDFRRQGHITSTFEVDGYDGQVLLAEDVMELLKLGETRVRNLTHKGVIKAWRASEFRIAIGIAPQNDLVLHDCDGHEFIITSKTYWIYDEASVMDYLQLREAGLAFGQRGRPRKLPPVHSPQANSDMRAAVHSLPSVSRIEVVVVEEEESAS